MRGADDSSSTTKPGLVCRSVPIVPKVKIAGSEDRCEELERVQLLAAYVDLLEDQTDRLSAIPAIKLDERHLIRCDLLDHISVEIVHQTKDILSFPSPVIQPPEVPVLAVEYLIQREHVLFEFPLSAGQIEHDVTPEIRSCHPIRRYADDRVFDVCSGA